jgi:hypothetical protein
MALILKNLFFKFKKKFFFFKFFFFFFFFQFLLTLHLLIILLYISNYQLFIIYLINFISEIDPEFQSLGRAQQFPFRPTTNSQILPIIPGGTDAFN